MFRFAKDSFSLWLDEHKLFYQFQEPLTTTIHSLITRVAHSMQNEGYRFEQSPLALLHHEALPLMLQSVVGMGRARPSDKQVHLMRQPVTTGLTLQHLIGDKKYVGALYFEDDPSRYVLHLSKSPTAVSCQVLIKIFQLLRTIHFVAMSMVVFTSVYRRPTGLGGSPIRMSLWSPSLSKDATHKTWDV